MRFIVKLLGISSIALPAAYFFIEEVQNEIKLQKNIFLKKDQISVLKKDQKIQIVNPNTKKNFNLKLNSVNQYFNNDQQTIVIIGGGIIGAAQAFQLCTKTNFNVIMLEKNSQIGQFSSYENGCMFGLDDTWINYKLFKDLAKSFLIESRIYIKLKGLTTPYILEWGLNMLYNLPGQRHIKNNKKLTEIQQLSYKEFENIFNNNIISKQQVDSNATGTIRLYQKSQDLQTKDVKELISEAKAKGYKINTLNSREDIIKLEPFLKNCDRQIGGAIVFQNIDFNVNTYKLLNVLTAHCENNYPDRFKLLCNTEVKQFIIEKDHADVVGIYTNKGAILADKYVICAGIYSTTVLKKLNIKLPLSPMRGFTVTTPFPESQIPLKYIIDFADKSDAMTMVDNDIRIPMMCDVVGNVTKRDEKRIQVVMRNAQSMVGSKVFNKEKSRVWTGLRPVSPDDLPILGPLTKFPNIFVNAGHGSKGMLTSLGCGRLIQEQISNIPRSLDEKNYSIDRFFLI